MAFPDDGFVYAYTDYRPSDVQRSGLRYQRGDSIEQLATLDRPRPAMSQFEGCGIRIAVPPLYAPEIVWSASSDRVASVAGVA